MKKKEEKTIRPPVVAIMGHVDHGKSTLLDYIQKTNAIRNEAGGITQHVMAYEITHNTQEESRKITFIDTPGHEAFLSMRSHGATIADVVILVVAADDGVKAQTLESLKIIKNIGIPFIVAINKIDKNNADIVKTKQSLAEAEVFLEGYGGHIPNAEISAKTGEGVDSLLDLILLLSDLEELTGDKKNGGQGFVLESHIDEKRGIVAQLVIKDGTLAVGEYIVTGGSVSKIKSIQDAQDKQIKKAHFSSPVNVSGFIKLPQSGHAFETAKTKLLAEKIASLAEVNDVLISDTTSEEEKYIPILIKADVLGTLQAIEQEIKKIKGDKISIKIIHKGVGDITESDAKAASGVKNPIVIGFNIKINKTAIETLDRYGIKPHIFDVIYKISEFLEPEIKKRKPIEEVLEKIAQASVIRLFSKTGRKQVIGVKIDEGEMKEKAKIKIYRNESEIGEGTIKELQVEKKKVKVASSGMQAGLTILSNTTISLSDNISIIGLVQK